MIAVTRLNGPQFLLNPDHIERAEATPDTVITLANGTKYVIAESLADVSELVRTWRAAVVATAERFTATPGAPTLTVVPGRTEG